MAILRLRWEKMNEGKNKKSSVLNQLQQLQLFAQDHIIHKTEYLHKQTGNPSPISEKKRKIQKVPSKSIKSKTAVLSRKHEYQKLESSGFDLVITQTGLFLGKKDTMVAVRYHNQLIKEIPFVNLKNISILCDGVSFSSNLVKSCAENKISIDFFGKDGMPYTTILTPTFFSSEIGIAQLESYSNGKGFTMIRKFVFGKINNQANLIKYYGKYYLKRNEAFRNDFQAFITSMEKYAENVMSLQHENLDEFRLKMFAIEGQASARYWEMVVLLIQSKSTFKGRERQGATDLVNSMLNYGYGMLYARVTETIIRARLNPCLSYLHKPEGNRPSLVFDLIEEFRQQGVDKVIIALVMKNKNLKVENGLLDDKTRKLVAQKVIDRMNAMEVFRNKEMRFYEIIQTQAVALANYLDGKAKAYKPYMPKW